MTQQATDVRERGVAVVTGASSGIGAASAKALAAEGFTVVIGARRLERIEKLAAEIGRGARAIRLDVTDDASVSAFASEVPECAVLVNNAGGAVHKDEIESSPIEDWQAMYDSNVLGTVRMTQALLPALVASGDGVVINVGSIAGVETYPGGAGYNAAKFAVHALTQVLRQELIGRPVRVTEVRPGMVHTEFTTVRFDGDEAASDATYKGMTPLTGEDIADAIAWIATRPPHVNIDEIQILPRDQVSTTQVHRSS